MNGAIAESRRALPAVGEPLTRRWRPFEQDSRRDPDAQHSPVVRFEGALPVIFDARPSPDRSSRAG